MLFPQTFQQKLLVTARIDGKGGTTMASAYKSAISTQAQPGPLITQIDDISTTQRIQGLPCGETGALGQQNLEAPRQRYPPAVWSAGAGERESRSYAPALSRSRAL